MEAFVTKEWREGVQSGVVDLQNGRKATLGDIYRAHQHLAAVLFPKEARGEFGKRRPDQGWLAGGGRKERRLKKEKPNERQKYLVI